MKYYYNLKGKNYGPVDLEELVNAEKKGIIDASTPVIEVGGKQWSRWATMRPAAPEPTLRPTVPLPRPSFSPMTLFEKLINFNESADRLIIRLFRLPACFPTEEAEQQKRMRQVANITALCIWLSYIIVSISYGCSPAAGDTPLLAVLLGGIVGGFLMQYILYQLYVMTNALLIGNKIALSSPAITRLFGLFSFIATLAAIVCIFTASSMPVLMLSLCAVLVCIVMTYLCFNAEAVLIKVCPSEVSPGREFNNIIRFQVRLLLLSIQLSLPIATLLVAVGFCFLTSNPFAMLRNYNLIIASLVIINLPFFSWLVLCISSWYFDLIDALFSLCALGSHEKK